MKILYGIQGTGNGHLTRAMEILPALEKRGHVDVLVSGMQSELSLPVEPKFKMHGLGFVFGKKGGIDLIETYRKSNLKKFYREVKEFDLSGYDVILSDFEPITAWAAMQQDRIAIGISNQAALLHPSVPKASSEDWVGRFIIRNYAPTPCYVGLSYSAYAEHIYTPIIRTSLRSAEISNQGHYVVYLPSYSDKKIIKVLKQLPEYDFHVFSKHASSAYQQGHIHIQPLSKERFEATVTSCAGIITAAGFGSTTEALYMGKKLLVVPQKNQFEQACNAHALGELGVTVIRSFKQKHLEQIVAWLTDAAAVQVDYPDQVEALLDDAWVQLHTTDDPYSNYLEREQYLLKSA